MFVSTPTELVRHQRHDIVLRLTELFVHNQQAFDDASQEMFGNIVLTILPHADVDTKQELSGKLSRCTITPLILAETLARDEILNVARPMLSMSEIVPAACLQELTQQRSDEFRVAIASRKELTSELSSLLARHGSSEVHLTLVRNPRAKLDSTAFAKILSNPFELAMQNAISYRPDIPSDILPQILARLPANERDRLTRIAAQHERARRNQHSSDQQRFGGKDGAGSFEELKADLSNIDDVIIRLSHAERPLDLCRLLAHAACETDQNVQDQFFKSDVRPLVQICKSASVGSEGFEEIAKIRAHRRRLGSSQIRAEVAAFLSAQADNGTGG